MMTEERKYELAARWKDLLGRADKMRNQCYERTAWSFEESAAKVEKELYENDADPRDYIE